VNQKVEPEGLNIVLKPNEYQCVNFNKPISVKQR
ncbi:MAG: hypothetical protein ACJA08_003423, partial [Cyclobacteriaceae bacterium]